jgi:hypothetical protein
MIIPEIKSLTIDGKLFNQNFAPPNGEKFSLQIRLIAGPKEGAGEESFDFTICTPKWLDENLKEGDVLVGRHYIFVKQYNYAQIRSRIEKVVNSSSAESWQQVGAKLGRLGLWEFEDYREPS